MRPGDVVLDLACGSGILGLFACRAGAARVYSVDSGGMAEIARSLAAQNGVADRMRVIKGFSTNVDLPEKADVVIADQIGNFGFNAGVFEFYADAYSRLLKPGARSVPQAISLEVAPWESSALFENVTVWGNPQHGFDTSPVLARAQNTGYQCQLESVSDGILGSVLASPEFPLNPPPGGLLRFSGISRIERSGTFHGVAGWFRATLSKGVAMTNSPLHPKCIKRRQIFLPFQRSIDVAPGQSVHLDFVIDPVEVLVNARVRIVNEAGTKVFDERHSTLLGMLLPDEDVRRSSGEFRPMLTRRGLARKAVVNLCDGSHTVDEIAASIRAEFPDVCATAAAARVFVVEVTTAYAK